MEKCKIISLDCESSGLDLFHSCKPFYVSICWESGQQKSWEWPVDPLTRIVGIDGDDVDEIGEIIQSADEVIGHNLRFDQHALNTLGLSIPWEKIHDTIIASHLLDSSAFRDLTATVTRYLGYPAGQDMKEREKRLRDAVQGARRMARSLYPDWKIAKEGMEGLPSAKKEVWRNDYWLPKCMAEAEGFDQDHEHYSWHTVLEDYALPDTSSVMFLWPIMREEIRKRGYWKHYEARREVSEVAYSMEHRGITVNKSEIERIKREYTQEADYLGKVCLGIAESYKYPLELPNGTRSDSLTKFLFDTMKVPVIARTAPSERFPDGQPSLTADVKEWYELNLDKTKKPHKFIKSFNRKAELDKAIGTLDSYEDFAIPMQEDGYAVIHPSYNPVGTSTLQWSSSNPNCQNVAEQSTANLRRVFCPAPGRVLYSMDAKNLQLRIPAYEADERDLIEVFEHPEKGPYFGSYHLLVYEVVHPEMFRLYGAKVKDADNPGFSRYKSVKCGNFCRQFGGQREKTDATFGVPGAYDKIAHRFPKIDALNKKYVQFADKHGYVETMPDTSIDAERGYPLWVERNQYDKVSPTQPFCYHIAGTAQQWMYRGMIRCEERLRQWRKEGFDAWMICQVHDEILLEFPKGDNLQRVVELKKLLEVGGDYISVPTPVTCEMHEESWAKGVSI